MEISTRTRRGHRHAIAAAVIGGLLVAGCGERDDASPAEPSRTDASAPAVSGSDGGATTTTTSTTTTTTSTTIVATVPSTTLAATTTIASTVVPPDVSTLPVPVATEPLPERTCYTVDEGNLAATIACEELHDGQVAAVGVALPGIDPSETNGDVWRFAVVAACREPLEEFAGVDLDDPNEVFSVDAVLTSTPGAAVVIACTAVRATGEPWAGSAETVVGAYSGIVVGECFDFPTPDRNAEEIACDLPHEAEMFVVDAALGIDAPAAPYPSHEEWADLARTICDGPFSLYIGGGLAHPELSYAYIYTLESDWDLTNSRTMSCAVVHTDGTRLVGSVRAG